MEFLLQFLLQIIGLIPFIYGLFKKDENGSNQIKINNIVVLQINPNYSNAIYNNVCSTSYDKNINVEKENKKWISYVSVTLICASLCIIAMYNLFNLPESKGNILNNLYIGSIIEPAIFLYCFLVIFYSALLLIGWEKNKKFLTNIKNMRLFFFDFITKSLMLCAMLKLKDIFSSYNFYNDFINNFYNMNLDWIFILLITNFLISIYTFYVSLTKIFSIEEKPVFLKDKFYNYITIALNYLIPLIIIVILWIN